VPAVDPEVAGKRIETFTTRVPTYLMIAAKKIAQRPLTGWPQQSDYASQWQAAVTDASAKRGILQRIGLGDILGRR